MKGQNRECRCFDGRTKMRARQLTRVAPAEAHDQLLVEAAHPVRAP